MAQLDNFLKGIADALREKEGSSELINPQDFAARIADLHVGGEGDKTFPQLNPATASKSGNTLVLSNPSTNGNFAVNYDFYSGAQKINRTAITTPYDLTQHAKGRYSVRVRIANDEHFEDSAPTAPIEIARYDTKKQIFNATVDFAENQKITNGQSYALTLVPDEDARLPQKVDVRINGEQPDYTYNAYTGAISITALGTDYSGDDEGKLNTGRVTYRRPHKLIFDQPIYASGYEVVDDTGVVVSDDFDDVIEPEPFDLTLSASGVFEPKLVAPYVEWQRGDSLLIQDPVFMDGSDVLDAITYQLKDGDFIDEEFASEQDLHTSFVEIVAENAYLYGNDSYKNYVRINNGNYDWQAYNYNSSRFYRYLKLKIKAFRDCRIRVYYYHYPYSSYASCYCSKLDADVGKDANAPSASVYEIASTGSSTASGSYDVDLTAGEHFLTFKICSTNSYTTAGQRYQRIGIREINE